MNYKREELDTYQLECLAEAEKLQAELIANGFMASRIEKGENRCDFRVIFFDGTHDYYIRRDYKGYVIVVRNNWYSFPCLSPSKRAEIYHKFDGDGVKVITAKKVQMLIDRENAIRAELEALEAEAKAKIAEFLKSIEHLPFKYSHENYQDPKSEVKSGSMVANGIEFNFEIYQDGYISKKITIHYSVDNTLENFLKLAHNKYQNG